MPTAFEKLEKILKLEQSQGFHDRAVIGGLSRFARVWQEEAHAASTDRSQIVHINEIADLLAQYETADKAKREQMVPSLLAKLGQPVAATESPRRPPPKKPGPPLTKPTAAPPSSSRGRGARRRPGTPRPWSRRRARGWAGRWRRG